MSITKQHIQNIGRPVLDEKEKIDREILKNKFVEHSVEALNVIVDIMKNSKSTANRLKASVFILNKVIPDGFVFDNVNNLVGTGNVTINLLPVGKTYQPNETDEEEIWEVENNDINEDWGEQVYYSKKEKITEDLII